VGRNTTYIIWPEYVCQDVPLHITREVEKTHFTEPSRTFRNEFVQNANRSYVVPILKVSRLSVPYMSSTKY